MKLTVLGSGSCIPRQSRAQPSYLLSLGKETILLDAGAGTQRQLLAAGFDYRKISGIFLTHLHPDHVNDLPAILLAFMNDKPARKKPLNLFGPKGMKKFYRTLLALYPCLRGTCFGVKARELKNSGFSFAGAVVETLPMKHSAGAIGYRIRHGGKVFAYTGDTGHCRNAVRLARNADLLLIECSFPNRMKKKFPAKMETHLTPGECGRIAGEAKAKRVVLTHLYPECESAGIRKEAGREFSGKITVAKDMMESSI